MIFDFSPTHLEGAQNFSLIIVPDAPTEFRNQSLILGIHSNPSIFNSFLYLNLLKTQCLSLLHLMCSLACVQKNLNCTLHMSLVANVYFLGIE